MSGDGFATMLDEMLVKLVRLEEDASAVKDSGRLGELADQVARMAATARAVSVRLRAARLDREADEVDAVVSRVVAVFDPGVEVSVA